MKPIAKFVSAFLLISLVVSMLPGCSLLPEGSSPASQSTPGTVTPHLDEKDQVDAIIPATGLEDFLKIAEEMVTAAAEIPGKDQ